MDPSHIVVCLAELIQTNLTITSPTSATQKEREIAHYLSDTINSLADCKRCHYAEEITLDLDDDCDPDSDSNSDTGQVNNDEYESEADNEGEYQKNDIEARHLTEYSKEFMQKVVSK